MTGVPAVVYAAKSTEGKRGSIDTQLADCRALVEREGWEVVAEFTDEGFSAYRGNRGPGLARAKAALTKHAVRARRPAHRPARTRRGRRAGAADHLMELFFWLGRQSIDLWAVQSGKVDRIRALLEGERNTKDSKRKSAATRDGLKRRADRGQPVGAVPMGYTVARRIVDENVVITQRVIDPNGRAVVDRIFDLIEVGHSPGQVSRTLNAEGARTVRGGPWTTRAVRRVATNPDYCGGTGYPQLLEPERWQRVNEGLQRLDPASVQARKGGRPAGGD